MSVVAGPLLLAAFGPGVKEIADIISLFDFSGSIQVDVRDEKKNVYLHEDLAPSYGALTSNTLKNLDDELKIMITATMKKLAKQTDRSWEGILSTMMQNPLIQPEGQPTVRSEMLLKDSVNDFKFDGSPDASIVHEVQAWFQKLIGDEDVLRSTKIDLPVMAKIVAQTGATITGILSMLSKHEVHSKSVVDIGVLRFPDIDHPHFKLYRIQLNAWSDCTRHLFHQVDKNGIAGTFNSYNFVPRKSVMKDMADKAHKAAVDEANQLFA
ncbi:hypothetical protein ACRALDRAFT_1070048 [Sodiomyces alcalophilus JCM 7366]|uniref:uncharacterized protein n=1 Tax=Sodiomyces alcalophilus JCM 7366 TaxID=591952 RepID=UPI0039B5E80E